MQMSTTEQFETKCYLSSKWHSQIAFLDHRLTLVNLENVRLID